MPHGRELARFRARIGMVFQQFDLFPHMTALQNVMSGPVIVKKMPKRRGRDVARDLLAKVGLADLRRRAIRASCRAASSSVSPSPAPWRWRRRSCCSTR